MDSCDYGNNFEVESGRGCRSKKKFFEPISCPVCCVTVRVSEVLSHYAVEMDKLNKIPRRHGTCNRPSRNGSKSNSSTKPWQIFQKIRFNREKRLRSRICRKKTEVILCPICNKEPDEDITLHVDQCLKMRQNNSDSDESVDVEAFEEYEWAGQTRIRITTSLPGGVNNLGTPIKMAENNEDLNVDEDDTQMYGDPQYTEKDIIPLPSEPENIALREALLGDDVMPLKEPESMPVENDSDNSEAHETPLIQVLKNRIRDLESRVINGDGIYKCLICMDKYHVPVISVSCWHVHCENCWLQTLGAKKLCPQCNMITSPGDLRKIYM